MTMNAQPVASLATILAATGATHVFEDCYRQHLSEMKALPLTKLRPVTLDIPTAFTTLLRFWPKISGLRERIASELPTINLASFDAIPSYAHAALHAHTLYSSLLISPEALAQMNEQALRTRENLSQDAAVLARRGLVDATRLESLGNPIGYRNVAVSVLGIVTVLRERWAQIEGRTVLTREELDQAEQLARGILTSVASRDEATTTSEAAQMRQRAFTLFTNAYDQARRAVIFLCWDAGDADLIAPSLYAGRSSGSRRKDDGKTTPVEETEGDAARPAPVSNASGTGRPSEPTGPRQPADPMPTDGPVEPGFPGSNPFLS